MLFDNRQEEINARLDHQQQRLAEDYQAIRGLANGYVELHLYNLQTGKYKPYFVEDEDSYNDNLIMSDYPDFFSAIAAFIENFCHPEDKEKMLPLANKDFLVKAMQNRKRFIVRFRCNTGIQGYRWCEYVITKFGHLNSDPVDFSAGYMDVNEVVEAELEAQRKEQMNLAALEEARLEKATKDERYNFLVNVAHELRTPLTLIIGPLNRVIKNGDLPDNEKGVITRACQQANRMKDLLNTVLTTNKIEAGAEGARPEPINFNEWIASISEEFRDEAGNHEMDIIVKLDPSIGAVNVDEHLCKIVFSNMMMNAMRHNGTGCPIEVSTKWSEDKSYVRLEVRDHGTGIGDIDVSKLFERYYRATEEKTGFGIGLSYSKTIVDAHKGRIGAYNNTENDGATFWFELPAPYSSRIAVADHKEEVAEPVEQEVPEGLKGKTLLYAEDDYDLRLYVQDEMGEICGKVLTAFNGKNALELMESNKVDVVVTDVMMPEIDGIELCRMLKSNPKYKDIPVIMLSARADADSVEKGLSAKADYYLDKPFDMDKLIDILKSKFEE